LEAKDTTLTPTAEGKMRKRPEASKMALGRQAKEVDEDEDERDTVCLAWDSISRSKGMRFAKSPGSTLSRAAEGDSAAFASAVRWRSKAAAGVSL